MITRLKALQERVSFWLHWIAIAVTSTILTFVLVLVYWVLEPDPVTVKVFNTNNSDCHDRQFSYELLPSLYAGVEHQRYFNKNGVKGMDESVNQVMVKWEF